MKTDDEDGLTPNQREFLRKLVQFKRSHGLPPTIREMQSLGGFRSPRSVVQYLDALVQAGYIERRPGARNIRLVRQPPTSVVQDRADTVEVPVVGHVAAGLPLLAEENIVGTARVSRAIARGGHTYFLLEVHGDSMDRAGINDGDLVLVRQQPTADQDDKVVALIDDSATVKRLRFAGDAVVLEPMSSNPANQPIILQRDFQIQGVVVAAIPHRVRA